MNPEIVKENNIQKESFLKEIIKFTIITLVIVIPIRKFVAQPFIVSGPSMDPTFVTGQYLIVDQLTYKFHNPKRNDVIVFRYPNNPKVFYIKRIIGLPGETVSVNSGKVTITNKENPNGFELNEDYISKIHRVSDTFTITLTENDYFVMGDNRAESSDSRQWGPLDKKFIIGRPFFRLIPLDILPGKE